MKASASLISSILLLFALAAAPAAQASNVRYDGWNHGLTYSAPTGEQNNLAISLAPGNRPSQVAVVFTDAGATIEPGSGCSTAGSSVICQASSSSTIRINLGDENDSLSFDASEPSGLVLEVNGGSGDDWLAGSPNADVLRGAEGNDQLAGLGGADQLYGNDGADQLRGGAGDDNLQGGLGSDHIYGNGGRDLLGGDFSVGYGTFQGNDFLYGGGGSDILGAWGGHNLLEAGSGNDILWSKGHNRLEPGTGSNIVNLLPSYDHTQLECGQGSNRLRYLRKPRHIAGKPPWATEGSYGFGSLWVLVIASSC